MSEEKKTEVAKPAEPKLITDMVLAKVVSLEKCGALRTPPDYSPENALKSAFLVLQETVDKDKNPVLESCTQTNIANALFNMVIRGLNPLKNQCYPVPYGKKLVMMPSYFGNIAMAKRVGMKQPVANIIYEGDKFVYGFDKTTGRKNLIDHEQKLENINIEKIKGAYCIYSMEPDGATNMEIMTIQQIKKAWAQGAAGGNSGAHKNFTDEMAKKTVINRVCKTIINSSDDSYLYETKEEKEVSEKVDLVKEEEANAKIFDITPEAEQIKETEKKNETKETPATETEKKIISEKKEKDKKENPGTQKPLF